MSVKNELDMLVKDIEPNKNIIYIFKGNEGRYSRIKNKFLTPVCLSDNKGYLTADGQLSIKELYDLKYSIYGYIECLIIVYSENINILLVHIYTIHFLKNKTIW